MGHADLVHVRKTHREAYIDRFRVFHDRIYFAADITGRFVYS